MIETKKGNNLFNIENNAGLGSKETNSLQKKEIAIFVTQSSSLIFCYQNIFYKMIIETYLKQKIKHIPIYLLL